MSTLLPLLPTLLLSTPLLPMLPIPLLSIPPLPTSLLPIPPLPQPPTKPLHPLSTLIKEKKPLSDPNWQSSILPLKGQTLELE